MKRYFVLALIAAAWAFGCSTWKSKETPTLPRLPQTQMSPDSVGIEIATVTLDSGNIHLLDTILMELDEQVMAPDQRRRLARNGFLGGVMGTQLPGPLPLLLLESATRREHPTAESMADVPDQQRFVQCRAGKRVGIGLWTGIKVLQTKHHDDEMFVDERFHDAACHMNAQCKPTRDGGAVIRLTPEIEHGALRQKYVADGGTFHVEAKRERKAYDDLRMEFVLQPGEMLLATCTEDADLLGQKIFRNATSTRQKILLVRLAQIHVDVAFEDE